MPSNRNIAFQGGGLIMFRVAGTNDEFRSFGNADDFVFAISEDKKNLPDNRKPQGGNAASSSKIKDVTLTINGLSYQPDVLAIGLRALIDHIPASVNAAEPLVYTAEVGSFNKTLEPIDRTKTVTVNEVSVGVLTEGVDYKVRATGIRMLTARSNACDVSYTSQSRSKIKALRGQALEYEILFDGFNKTDNGKSVIVEAWKAKFSPTTALALISDDFGSVPMTIDLVSDNTRGNGDSRFFNIEMED